MSEISELTETKTIGVSPETYKELVSVGRYGETMDQIVKKCVEAYKREQQQERKVRSKK